METARSHSVTMQTGAPDEAENPGRADSARPGRRHQPRGDWAGDGIVVLSSPQPFVGFSGVTAMSCGETQLFIPVGAQRIFQEFGDQESMIRCISKGVSDEQSQIMYSDQSGCSVFPQ